MGRTIFKTLIFNMNMSKLAQILETSYKQAENWESYKFLKMTIGLLLEDLGAEYRLNKSNE